jgi:hypothetical protein
VRLITIEHPGLSFWQPDNSPYGRVKWPVDEWRQSPGSKKDLPDSPLGIDGKVGAFGLLLYLPYWFLVGASVAMATASWLTWRFSLRTLLIATTLVTVLLGLVVWAAN